MKRFNTTGVCIPEWHYMVDISGKIEKIMKMIEYGDYFTINRARQYGKTTTLRMLQHTLPGDYICVNISFEGVGNSTFDNQSVFCQRFLAEISKKLKAFDEGFAAQWQNENVTDFYLLANHIESLIVNRKIVLTIDEVDRMSSNEIFLQFLAMLRNQYLYRDSTPAFQSVILAGVHDIKNIKLKLKKEGLLSSSEDTGKLLNSPWNIAADFMVDMSFNPAEIATMLSDYENHRKTGMCISSISNEIYKYTNGYPYLVSRLCQLIEDRLDSNWSIPGVLDAVKIITATEKNTLYDELFKNLRNNKEIYDFMYAILILGEKRSHSRYSHAVEWSEMLGFVLSSKSGELTVANKIFEAVLLEYFVSEESAASLIRKETCNLLHRDITKDGIFNMELCLRKFAEFYSRIYTDADAPALERHARLTFLAYLHPLVNGHGFYHIESQFTDLRRMDIVLDYGTSQYIIELKLWRGESSHDRAYEQILGYMNAKNASKGYILTFDLRNKKNRKPKAEWITVEGKQVFDVVV